MHARALMREQQSDICMVTAMPDRMLIVVRSKWLMRACSNSVIDSMKEGVMHCSIVVGEQKIQDGGRFVGNFTYSRTLWS